MLDPYKAVPGAAKTAISGLCPTNYNGIVDYADSLIFHDTEEILFESVTGDTLAVTRFINAELESVLRRCEASL